ncbi:hypothetical protein HPB50_022503 [Hyalomma asiaticum]|uniref:Uncharacterized protein n=1 Tax=Hyalomma asiaticum TaxID=266040 RepID=A0ACB7SB15_HYAAI|nr:hypothetical protein HPB50_022503 [Hyalomma asiaticum]
MEAKSRAPLPFCRVLCQPGRQASATSVRVPFLPSKKRAAPVRSGEGGEPGSMRRPWPHERVRFVLARPRQLRQSGPPAPYTHAATRPRAQASGSPHGVGRMRWQNLLNGVRHSSELSFW